MTDVCVFSSNFLNSSPLRGCLYGTNVCVFHFKAECLGVNRTCGAG